MLDENLLRFNKTAKLCFLDLETENLCLFLDRNLPWQAAMLKVEGDSASEEYMRYIKWYRPANVSPEAAIVTRFRPEMVTMQGTDYKSVIEDIVKWTSEADYIFGHNILGFDIYFLTAFYQMVGKSSAGLAEKTIDTHPLAKGVKLQDFFSYKKCSLLEYQYRMLHTIAKGVKTRTSVLGPEYGIVHDYENLHDALNDLHLNLKIWNKIKTMVEV